MQRPSPAPKPTAGHTAESEAEPIPERLRHRAERSLRAPLSDVRLYRGAIGRGVSAAHGGRAATFGRSIFLGADAQRTGAQGEKTLAHELVHAAQPQAGGLRGTSAPSDPAENQARQLAPSVLAGRPALAYLQPRRALVHRDDPPGVPTTPAAASPPVLWGIDTNTRAIYASVAVPGRPISEVAAWMYGSADAAVAIRATNSSLPEVLPPGTIVRPTGDPLSTGAHAALQRALDQGTILRTDGVPSSELGPLVSYRFSAGGTEYDLTPAQYDAMLRGLAVYLCRKARYFRGMIEAVQETHIDHVENTNSVVRGTVDLFNDFEPPSTMRYVVELVRADVILGMVGDSAELSGESIAQAARELRKLAVGYDVIDRRWRNYINGTIGAAERTVSRLEFVRDTAFVTAAGLAAVVAAPIVIPASGVTLGTGAAALGVGGLAGGTTYAGLEFSSSVSGQALANAITPGPSAGIDWGEVGDRTATGAWRGTVAGVVVAGGVLAAPAVTASVAGRFGLTMEGLATASTGTRAAVGFFSGVTIGAPSGLVQTAITELPALARGDIDSGTYLSRIGWGTLSGAAFGGVFGAVTTVRAPRPGTALESAGPPGRGGGTGSSGAASPDFVVEPPVVDAASGRVSQTATHLASGEQVRMDFDPLTGRATMVRLSSGEVMVVNVGTGGPTLGSGGGTGGSGSSLTVIGSPGAAPAAAPLLPALPPGAPVPGITALALRPPTSLAVPPRSTVIAAPTPAIPAAPRGPIITPAPPVYRALGPGPPTTYTLAQIRNMRQPYKWQAGELYMQEIHGSPGQRHYPVPTSSGGPFPVTRPGGRYVDAPVPTARGGTRAIEVKTYGRWRTVNSEPRMQEVPLSDHIREQIAKDVALRAADPTFDPQWSFLDAPPSAALRDELNRANILFIIYH